MTDSFGPLTKSGLQKLADAPYGHAKKIIQQSVDPLWGREPGKKFRWNVRATIEAHAECSVVAETEAEAKRMVEEMPSNDFDIIEIQAVDIVKLTTDK